MSTLPKVLSCIAFENISPLVNSGDYPLKREPSENVEVSADIFRIGHEKIGANLLFRKKGNTAWKKEPMEHVDNDLWKGQFRVDEIGFYEYTLEAYTIPFSKKTTRFNRIFQVRVDPLYARFGTWYEMFPRSQGKIPGKSATWYDCMERLSEIKELGFDTIYLVPIHPIGKTNRKGKNNSLVAKKNEPGSPYAVGNEHGGHLAVDPDLGTMKDFEQFVKASKKQGFRLALDIALNCSPDHPHVKEHPEWFFYESDGTIKCAENPPKKYEDIYPYDFLNKENWKGLWEEIRDMILYWADKGFTIFRIDNPHTKPFMFWEWIISEIKNINPELIFLAEAFTRPKIMHHLAKLGFDMSYTYFTWRTEKWELEEYFIELTQSHAKEYMRGMLFPTTPDILPEILQNAKSEAFTMRAFLAATLSSLFGMYNGYELCETVPYPGKEELFHSEKYEYKVRDWNAPGNIKSFIKVLNSIRNSFSAFQHYDNLKFHYVDNEQIMAYSKTGDSNDKMLCIVNLDTNNIQSGMVHLELESLGLTDDQNYLVKDVLNNNETYQWQGGNNFVVLDPRKSPGHIFQIIESQAAANTPAKGL